MSQNPLATKVKESERILNNRSSTTGKKLEERRIDIAKISNTVEQMTIAITRDNEIRKQKRILLDKIKSAKSEAKEPRDDVEQNPAPK